MSRRLVLAIGLLCAAALLAASVERRDAEARLARMSADATRERARTIRTLLAGVAERPAAFIATNGAWDELAGDVEAGRPGLASESLASSWDRHAIRGLFVYRRDGSLLETVRPNPALRGWHPGRVLEIRGSVGPGLPARRFFARTPAGLARVFVTTVARSADEARKGRVYGYLVAMRYWKDADLRDLARMTGTRVSIVTKEARQARATALTPDRFAWFEPLTDARGRTFAYRAFEANSPELAQYGIAMLRGQALVVLLVVGLLAVLGVLLGYTVGRPLRLMRAAVESGSTDRLGRLLEDPTEIGDQARLIESWFLLKGELTNTNEWLEHQVRERTRELNEAYLGTIRSLVTALEFRDQETKGHCERVTGMAETIARRLRLSEIEIDDLKRGALLHDIGKIAIPDVVLLKPGKLTEPERAMMETHASIGYEMLRDIRFLERSLDVCRSHHEKWDGTGYPEGLAGEDIPLAARIFAVADVWDALSTTRPYRTAWPPERVRAHIPRTVREPLRPHRRRRLRAAPDGGLPDGVGRGAGGGVARRKEEGGRREQGAGSRTNTILNPAT